MIIYNLLSVDRARYGHYAREPAKYSSSVSVDFQLENPRAVGARSTTADRNSGMLITQERDHI